MLPTAEPMTAQECWEQVGNSGAGRVGFDAGKGPRIHPVNYTSDGSEVYVLTSETSELARFTRLFAEGSLLTFEVDQLDPAQGDCWSVLVSGHAIDAEEHGPDDPALRPSPEPAGERTWWVRLVPTQVTGRRLTPAESAASVPVADGA